MTINPLGDGQRKGAVRNRSQTYNPQNGHWVKRARQRYWSVHGSESWQQAFQRRNKGEIRCQMQ